MTLEEMIEFCKGIDWDCDNPFPPNIPNAVRSTMKAVNEMWLEWKRDSPEEVQEWLAEEWGPQVLNTPISCITQNHVIQTL